MVRTASVTSKCTVYCVHFHNSVTLIITLLNFVQNVQATYYYTAAL